MQFLSFGGRFLQQFNSFPENNRILLSQASTIYFLTENTAIILYIHNFCHHLPTKWIPEQLKWKKILLQHEIFKNF